MKKWLWLAVALVLALLAWTAAGPYLTIRAIGNAVQARDEVALAKQVDFPTLRGSLKAQLADRIVRGADDLVQDNPLAAFGRTVATGLASGLVDAMVTPAGLGAIMEGRRTWDRIGSGPRPSGEEAGTEDEPRPLQDAEHRFESPSRFTATVHDASGRPVLFVLTRRGLGWKLSDIRLPPP